jgi:putative tryptophan/tyrosine transport system substrate-binding protein
MHLFAKELVRLNPNVLLGITTPAVAALQRETRTIPIVFALVSDPLGSGFVTSPAYPGGNITGFSSFEASVGGKWLELMREVAPGVSRAAIIYNPDMAPFAKYLFGYVPIRCVGACHRADRSPCSRRRRG